MILMLRNAQDLEEGQAHLQLPGIDGHGHGHGHGEEESINLKGAVIHVLGDLIQSLGVAAAGALIWWKQVRLWEIPFARLPALRAALLCRAPCPLHYFVDVRCCRPYLQQPGRAAGMTGTSCWCSRGRQQHAMLSAA